MMEKIEIAKEGTVLADNSLATSDNATVSDIEDIPIVEVPFITTTDVVDLDLNLLAFHLDSVIELPEQPPSWLDAFLGTYFDKRKGLIDALLVADRALDKLSQQTGAQTHKTDVSTNDQRIARLVEVQRQIRKSLKIYTITPAKKWAYQLSAGIFLFLTTVFLLIVVEIYARWHGTTVLGNLLDFYNPEQVDILSQITFVNGATALSVAFEILVWSSVGVWAQQAYINSRRTLDRRFRFGDHGLMYIGVMMRSTGVAVAVILLLRLSQFSLFGVSLDNGNPYAFDATVGLAFVLGFFGDDTIKVLSSFRDVVIGSAKKYQDS